MYLTNLNQIHQTVLEVQQLIRESINATKGINFYPKFI